MNSILKSLEELWKMSEAEMLLSTTEEQSGLINILKQKADELLVRCDAVRELNTELEARVAGYQKDLEQERKRSATLEKRFAVLAANNQAITVFKDEYKKQNAQLRQENRILLSENKTLFSQKLEDKDALIQKLQQELRHLSENYTCLQSQLQEEAAQHQCKEASLRDRLHQAQQQHKDAVELCKVLKLQLQKSEEKHALLEQTMNESIETLKKDKNSLLHLTTEHEKTIQVKQQEMQQLETKCKEEKTARLKAEDRFEREAAAVKKDAKVKSLQCALDVSQTQYNKLKMDFEAFKEHMKDLLAQERLLNATLRHMNY
ncbi:coiled-coil domain-containing protein 89-like [Thalassophryne amazonica]|uniref:coiled-coil domain-containing protein 89-like n=1 Tax=Thalassophryne amazonica TaxID=390379 RepID=UPI001470B0D6|nr:coiled-coil domain-containing protein 89-like [Thalassophryne amazonica]